MCHEWWRRRMLDEREASREIWDEFERTRPVSDPRESEQEPEVTLEQLEARPLAKD
jgi:hypothetical protein